MSEREPPPLDGFEEEDLDDVKSEPEDLFQSAIEFPSEPRTQQLTDNGPGTTNSSSNVASMMTSSSEMFTSAAVSPAARPETKTSTNKPEDDGNDEFLEILVTEPAKQGDGMGAYIAYKVTTRTNIPYFKKKNLGVLRRFSDFLGLHDKLVEKHLHLGRIIPPAPEKSVIGMTKIKITKESDGGSSGDFVERRRAALQRFVQRVGHHPVLRTDPDFREFLESERELPKATNTSTLSGAGMIRLLSRVGDTVNKITFKMEESDPWFEEKQQFIENLDQHLRKLHASVETLVQHRKDMALSTGNFAKSVALLSSCEERSWLSQALSKLADVEEHIEQLQQEQANADFFLLAELLKDYISLIAAVKEAFHQRVKVYQTWQHAQQTLTKKREIKAKLELAQRNDKISQAKDEIVEWEAKVNRAQEEFDSVSKMIRKEVERFDTHRITDFKSIFIKYLEVLMKTQTQVIKHWEGFLPQAKAIS